MKTGEKYERVDLEKRVFDVKNERMPKGAWWWWFWLFFFDNPKDQSKPRQLMILWSAKNVNKIKCNNLDINAKLPLDRENLDGAVAAWYFDGERMHHEFLLEQCSIKVSGRKLLSESVIPTSFSVSGKRSVVKIGDDFEFIADENGMHDFSKAGYRMKNFVGEKGYSIMKVNHTDLTGKVNGEKIKGTAYFQRVFLNAPAIPWYWGIFHFDGGAVMSYTNQLILGKSIRKDISLFDGERMHEFGSINVKRTGKTLPVFRVTGENEHERISFSVVSYAHSEWTFRNKSWGVVPSKLVYNEYPAAITDIEIEDKATRAKLTSKELGKAVGNAEHATGMLF
jgi:hypothetical protein